MLQLWRHWTFKLIIQNMWQRFIQFSKFKLFNIIHIVWWLFLMFVLVIAKSTTSTKPAPGPSTVPLPGPLTKGQTTNEGLLFNIHTIILYIIILNLFLFYDFKLWINFLVNNASSLQVTTEDKKYHGGQGPQEYAESIPISKL